MTNNSEWGDVGSEEQALLGRCKKFVLGHSDSPGRGSKDILYLTPCGRWLRICSGDVYFRRPDYGDIEFADRIDSGRAAELFEEYRWPRPGELDHATVERDFEVCTDLKYNMFNSLSSSNGRTTADMSDDPTGMLGAEERIERNAVVVVLSRWATEWPTTTVADGPPPGSGTSTRPPEQPVPASPGDVADGPMAGSGILTNSPDQSVRLRPSEAAILQVLVETRYRITTNVLMGLMSRDGQHPSVGTTKMALAQLVKLGLLDNDPKAEPRGYGPTEAGRRFIQDNY